MSQIPAEVLVTELPEGVHYRFPLRPRGGFVWAGFAHLLGGAMGVAFMTFWLRALGSENPRQGMRDADGMVLLFLLFGCFMLVLALRLAARGVTLLMGHSEIALRGASLYGYECWGPLRWRWRREVHGLVRFDVRDVSVGEESVATYTTPESATEYNAITALWESDGELTPQKRKRLAWGYPRDWLLPVTEDLSRRCRLAGEPSARVTASQTAIPIAVEPLPNQAGFVDLIEQPRGSEIQVECLGGRLRLTRRKYFTLEVQRDGMRVVQRSVFRASEYRWSREQLAEIKVGKHVDSEGPDTPLLLIRPHPGEGDLIRLPVKEEGDARWLATLLLDTLQLPKSDWDTPGGAFCERNQPPVDSPIVLERGDHRLSFIVPLYGLSRPMRASAGAFLLPIAVGLAAFALFHVPGYKALIQGLGLTPFAGAVLVALAGAGFVFLAFIQHARRRASLVLDDLKLRVRQTGFFRTEVQTVLRSRIVDVRVGYHIHPWASSSTRQTVRDTGGVPWELQVFTNDGERLGVLDGVSPQELQWMATVLRHELTRTRSTTSRADA